MIDRVFVHVEQNCGLGEEGDWVQSGEGGEESGGGRGGCFPASLLLLAFPKGKGLDSCLGDPDSGLRAGREGEDLAMCAVGEVVGEAIVGGQDTEDGGPRAIDEEGGRDEACGGRVGGRGGVNDNDAGVVVLGLVHVLGGGGTVWCGGCGGRGEEEKSSEGKEEGLDWTCLVHS